MSAEADLLRRAADLVRERGERAGAPRVRWEQSSTPTVVVDGNFLVASTEHGTGPDGAAWIALVGPQLAEPLAAWLDEAADYVDADDECAFRILDHTKPLAVARALVGEAP